MVTPDRKQQYMELATPSGESMWLAHHFFFPSLLLVPFLMLLSPFCLIQNCCFCSHIKKATFSFDTSVAVFLFHSLRCRPFSGFLPKNYGGPAETPKLFCRITSGKAPQPWTSNPSFHLNFLVPEFPLSERTNVFVVILRGLLCFLIFYPRYCGTPLYSLKTLKILFSKCVFPGCNEAASSSYPNFPFLS